MLFGTLQCDGKINPPNYLYEYQALCGKLGTHFFAYSSFIHLVCLFGNDMPKPQVTQVHSFAGWTLLFTLAIKDTRDLTVIPHSHRKQQSPHTSRWLRLKTNVGLKKNLSQRETERKHFGLQKRSRSNWSFLKHLRSKYSFFCMKFAQIHGTKQEFR